MYNRQVVLYKKVVLKNFATFSEKTPMLESLFDKNVGRQP